MPAGRMTLASRGSLSRRQQHARSTRAIAKRALRVAKSNVGEIKDHNVTDSTVPSTTMAIIGQDYLNIAQGDTQNSRDGNKIRLLGIKLKAFFAAEQSELADGMSYCRVAMVAYTSCDDVPAVPGPWNADTIDAQLTNNRLKQRVLYDRVFMVGSQDAAAGASLGPGGFHIEKWIPWRKQLNFLTSGTQAPSNAQLVLYVFSNLTYTSSSLETSVQTLFRDS